MVEKYINLSLDDERIGKVAEILSNKTCKKILDYLAEKNASESEISKELKIPLNTVGYNIKKLKKEGLIQEKSHFWSLRGKRIPVYTVSNKKIVISPIRKKNLRKTLPVVLVSAVFSFFLLLYDKTNLFYEEKVSDVGIGIMDHAPETLPFLGLGIVDWFLIGLWLVIIVFVSKSIIDDKKN